MNGVLIVYIQWAFRGLRGGARRYLNPLGRNAGSADPSLQKCSPPNSMPSNHQRRDIHEIYYASVIIKPFNNFYVCLQFSNIINVGRDMPSGGRFLAN